MVKETIKFPAEGGRKPTTGTAGLRCQVPGTAATVSALAYATGGISPSGFVKTDTK